jgi:hypothetical protein
MSRKTLETVTIPKKIHGHHTIPAMVFTPKDDPM